LASVQGHRIVASMSPSLAGLGRTWRVRTFAVIALVVVIGGVVIGSRLAAWPDGSDPIEPDPRAGQQVQHVLAQLFLREAGLSSREDPLVLSATEVNAFLTGHVVVRDPPVWPVHIRIHPDGVELGGVTTLGRLLASGLGPGVASVLPAVVRSQPVWVAVRGGVAVLPGGQAEFRAHSATMGRQRVPVAALWRAVGGRPQALTWRMPRVVNRVDLESGRLLIYTRRAASARGSPG
jgi:hypothetical protein